MEGEIRRKRHGKRGAEVRREKGEHMEGEI